MNQDRKDFLSVTGVIPARLDSQETAWFLGFAEHHIPILIHVGLLNPLGHPSRNGIKFFSTSELEKLRTDTKWLSRATDAIAKCWKDKNATKLQREVQSAFPNRQSEVIRP